MLENLLWGLTRFVLFLVPLYVFMLNSLNQKYHFHDTFELIFNEFNVTIGIPVIGFFALVYTNVWRTTEITVLMWIIYTTFFFGIYYYLTHQISYFQSFVIASLSIFAISEIWEIPIKLNNLLSLPTGQEVGNLIVFSIFKMSSIPMLIYFAKVWNWKTTKEAKECLIIFFLLSTIALLEGLTRTDFLYGILLRLIVGITISLTAIGYSKSRNVLGK